jgi:hypothetical protein
MSYPKTNSAYEGGDLVPSCYGKLAIVFRLKNLGNSSSMCVNDSSLMRKD